MTSRTFQGPILLPERLYHSSSTPFTSPRRPSPPVTIRHVSSSPILHNNYDVIKKKSTFHDVPKRKDQCLCAPPTHPGSFKCSMHGNSSYSSNVISFNVKSEYGGGNSVSLFHRLYVRRKALVNCLKRLRTVDSGLLRRSLAWLVKPPACQLRRREEFFQPRQSRLSVMSKAGD